jgi:hypothetical protein
MAQGTGKGKERIVEQKGNSRFNIQDSRLFSVINDQLSATNYQRGKRKGSWIQPPSS